MKFAYADPPYIGQAKRHYSHDPNCAEVDHNQMRKQGDICRTPFEPSGLVMVIEVWDRAEPRPAARIVHLEDHPHGYKRGETGWYHADELIVVDAEVVQRSGSAGGEAWLTKLRTENRIMTLATEIQKKSQRPIFGQGG